jgi:tetratricopeptide (TPR) repeat protein/tRNA A-37 threonylcarbamoyl transferase component Bud32
MSADHQEADHDDSSVLELLEEILDYGRSPEEVCAECPDLLSEVRRRLRRLRSMEAQIEDLFPSSQGSPEKAAAQFGSLDVALPQIPGYEVQSLIGHGGMGVVYKARHIRLNRIVAIKMLLSGIYASATQRTRFMHEAEAVARLTHCNVVQLHDIGDFDGRPYFTMEFVDGGTLAHKLTGIPKPAAEAVALIKTLAMAVDVAHRAGIVHRDLKPGNILVCVDGTPKISDFGLSRLVDGDDSDITLSGTRIGTPSYMAPEQATGNSKDIGPATDVYALGAMLYELLTGRPPFRAETASETQRQLIERDAVPPSRLNAKVPRDIETICLKCLHKDPQRRYETAASLADDLLRFEHGEPISARPTGFMERTAKWIWRHPAITASAVGFLLLAAVLTSGGVGLTLQRARLAHAVEADLTEVASLQRQSRWAEARAALDRAEARLGSGGSSDLRQQLAHATSDLDLVMKLDRIRLSRVTSGQLVVYKRRANEKYAELFQQTGLGSVSDDPAGVAARINASAVRAALIAAIDDWSNCASDPQLHNWVLAVARRADPDPAGWRDRALDASKWNDAAALSELASSIPIEGQSLSLMLALAERLRSAGKDPSAFLRRVQKEHPDDFWANLVLGNALLFRLPAEARGYYQAALASRPDAAVGYCAVGDALRLQHSLDEAVHYYQRSIHQDPQYARGYSNLGLAYENQGKLTEAVTYYKKSLEIDPEYSWSYYNLGNTLRAMGQFDAALEQYRKADSLDPDNWLIRMDIRTVLVHQGHAQEVWADWHKLIETQPRRLEDWWGYAELCLYLGKTDAYEQARQMLLERFGGSDDPLITEKVARACLMLPGTEQQLSDAVALADRAISAKASVDDWLVPYFMFAKGLAEYRQGHFGSTIAIMQADAAKVLGPAPRLLMAMAQQKQGDAIEARKTLTSAIASFNWSPSIADSRDIWMMHILRREAEATILRDQASSKPRQ